MAILILPDGNKQVPVEDAIYHDDERIRATLAMLYGDNLASIGFEKKEENGKLTIRVTKRAGSKGLNTDGKNVSEVLMVLREAVPAPNPALLMAIRLKNLNRTGQLNDELLLNLQGEIYQSAKAGEQMATQLARSLRQLKEALPGRAETIPEGF
jgi:hypothetical protein